MSTVNEILALVRLRFNIQQPSLGDCYSFGYECALQDVEEEANPFTEGSREYQFWNEGWWAGFYGEEPLYKNDSLDVTAYKPEDAILAKLRAKDAANDKFYKYDFKTLLTVESAEIGGTVAAAIVVGYQLLELVI